MCPVIRINRRATERVRLQRQSSDTETKRNLKKPSPPDVAANSRRFCCM
jgi:hypothetical protein